MRIGGRIIDEKEIDLADKFTEVKTSLGQLLKLEYESTTPGLSEGDRCSKIEIALGMLLGYAASEKLLIDIGDEDKEMLVSLAHYFRNLKRNLKRPDILYTNSEQDFNVEVDSRIKHTADKFSVDQVELVADKGENQAWHKYKTELFDLYYQTRIEVQIQRPEAIPWRDNISDNAESAGDYAASVGLE